MLQLAQPFRSTLSALTRPFQRPAADLNRALRAGELAPHYEPIVSLQSRRIVGFEALMRWNHPIRGWVSPAEFIPLAEETGLIVPLGEVVLRDACQRLAQWRDLSVSVNVSRRQLADASFVPMLASVLRETRVQPESLTLEITESTIMEDAGEKVLWRVRDLGVSLHMDDFGTGYSSLSCLHKLPIDVVKIDRSFIHNTSACHDYKPVLHAIVSLAHNLGLEVIAEGLETPTQAALLRAMGCDYGQGYLYSKAIPPGQVATFLRESEQRLKIA